MIYLIRSTYIQLEQNRSAFVGLPQDYHGFFFFLQKSVRKFCCFYHSHFLQPRRSIRMPGEVGTCQWEYFSQVLSAEFSCMRCFLSHRDLCWECSDIWKLKQPLLLTQMLMCRKQHPSAATSPWGGGQGRGFPRALQGSPKSLCERVSPPITST